MKGGNKRPDRERRDRGDRKERGGARDEFGNARLFLTTGKQDGATPPKILEMIEQDFGVQGHVVGDIDIMESYSFISVPFKEAEIIMDAFHALKKKRRPPVRVERAAEGKRTHERGGKLNQNRKKKKGGKKRR